MISRIEWLVDANVVSELMRPLPEPAVLAFLDRRGAATLGIAAVTEWEILNGFGKMRAGGRRSELEARFRDFRERLFGDRVVEWTSEDAQICARIMEDRRRRGESLDAQLADAFLAATAVRRGLTIVTRNTRDFRNTGARTVNPWAVG